MAKNVIHDITHIVIQAIFLYTEIVLFPDEVVVGTFFN